MTPWPLQVPAHARPQRAGEAIPPGPNGYMARALSRVRLSTNAALMVTVILLSACGSASDAETAFYARDYRRSLSGFTERARAGDAVAQNFLGMHYYAGLGVARDYQAALRWFERAALAGQPDAQRNLGMMYMQGYGTTANKVLAYGWMRMARSGGNASANAYLQQLSNQITPNQTEQAIKIVSEMIRKADVKDQESGTL